jgi:hypothetical protein
MSSFHLLSEPPSIADQGYAIGDYLIRTFDHLTRSLAAKQVHQDVGVKNKLSTIENHARSLSAANS